MLEAALILGGVILGWMLRHLFDGLSFPAPHSGLFVRASSPEEALSAILPQPHERYLSDVVVTPVEGSDDLWLVEINYGGH